MYLKRLYSHPDPAKIDPATAKVRGVQIKSAPSIKHFSPSLIESGTAEGWLSTIKGQFIFHGEDGDVIYKVNRGPGYYCCHCGLKLPGVPGDGIDKNPERPGHVASAHPGIASPDPANPAGYRGIAYYDCSKVEG